MRLPLLWVGSPSALRSTAPSRSPDPERFGLDELVRIGLGLKGDPRPVLADVEARYFGAHLEASTLLPSAEAHLGEVRFRDWAPPMAR
jgi:hypothetical protein